MARQMPRLRTGIFSRSSLRAPPAQYDAVTAQAKREIGRGYRPALKGRLPDIGAYDVVFVGFALLVGHRRAARGDVPCRVRLVGKDVAPFMTHGGSRMGRSEDDIEKLCTRGLPCWAGLPVRGSAVKGSR